MLNYSVAELRYYVNEPHLRAYLKNNADVVKHWGDDEEVWKSEGEEKDS